MLGKFIGNPFRVIDRDGKSDSLVAAVARCDRGADRNRSSLQIDQRASRIAWIDGRIGLDQSAAIDPFQRPILGTDDAGADGRFQPKRAADGKHPVADFDRIGVSQFGTRESSCALGTNS